MRLHSDKKTLIACFCLDNTTKFDEMDNFHSTYNVMNKNDTHIKITQLHCNGTRLYKLVFGTLNESSPCLFLNRPLGYGLPFAGQIELAHKLNNQTMVFTSRSFGLYYGVGLKIRNDFTCSGSNPGRFTLL